MISNSTSIYSALSNASRWTDGVILHKDTSDPALMAGFVIFVPFLNSYKTIYMPDIYYICSEKPNPITFL